MEFSGKHVVIIGLARSGLAAARLLAGKGARVTVNDLKREEELGDIVHQVGRLGIECVFGSHPDVLLDSADLVVLSPGVPRAIPPVRRLLDRGTPIWAEVELAARFLEEKLIGITGSNGKSTTTALTAHLLIQSGIRSRACGNIGTALSSLVDDSDPKRVLAVELSSFQLESIHQFHPAVATVLNVTPDHMDRYPDFDAYKQAKLRIFENQDGADLAVINRDETHWSEISQKVAGRIFYFSAEEQVEEGVCLNDGVLVWRDGRSEHELIPAVELSLPGPHNVQNAMAAATMALLAGASLEGVRRGLREFTALEHRLEPVEDVHGVLWVNDSKATNVDSALVALQSYQRPVHLLLGGRDKDGEFERLAEAVRERVKQLYLLGEAAPVIEKALGGQAEILHCESMEHFVREAHGRAEEGDVVLMAPGCASFDMYDNFEERGLDFKRQVRKVLHGEL